MRTIWFLGPEKRTQLPPVTCPCRWLARPPAKPSPGPRRAEGQAGECGRSSCRGLRRAGHSCGAAGRGGRLWGGPPLRPPACSCGRPALAAQSSPGWSPGLQTLGTGRGLPRLVPGSRGSCPQRSCVCVHSLPGPGQLLGAGLHNGAAVQGRTRPDRHARCGGDRRPIQHWRSVLGPRLHAPGVGGPAQTPVPLSGTEAATWLTLA